MLSSPRGWLDISTWIRSLISWKLLHSCSWIGNTLSNNCCHIGVKQPKNGAKKKYGRSQPGPWINPQFYYPLISIIYINKLAFPESFKLSFLKPTAERIQTDVNISTRKSAKGQVKGVKMRKCLHGTLHSQLGSRQSVCWSSGKHTDTKYSSSRPEPLRYHTWPTQTWALLLPQENHLGFAQWRVSAVWGPWVHQGLLCNTPWGSKCELLVI